MTFGTSDGGETETSLFGFRFAVANEFEKDRVCRFYYSSHTNYNVFFFLGLVLFWGFSAIVYWKHCTAQVNAGRYCGV